LILSKKDIREEKEGKENTKMLHGFEKYFKV